MPSLLPAALCCLLLALASAESSPKVLGFHFQKEARRDSLERRAIAIEDAIQKRDILQARAKSVEADIGNAELLYYINVTIGTPGQEFMLQLDTGSSDVWVPWTGSNVCQSRQGAYCQLTGGYDPTSSSTYDHISSGFAISYVDGSTITGEYISDTLVIGSTSITNMTMGLARRADRALGLMGIGYQNGESIASHCPDCTYPNVINQLKDQGYINSLAYSLWLNDLEADTGSILFGGVDTAKYHGDLVALPVLKDLRTNNFRTLAVALNSVTFKNGNGKADYMQSNLAMPVVLDSGTTLTYLPAAIANDIIGGVGAFPYGSTYLVACSLANSKATLEFNFGGQGGSTIAIDISEFVLPIINTQTGRQPALNDGTIVCQWGLQPTLSNSPNLFGDTFLRSAYVVYDLENNIIALASTKFNVTEDNIQEIPIGSNIPGVARTATATANGVTASGIPLATQGVTVGLTTSRLGLGATPTFDLSHNSVASATAATTASDRNPTQAGNASGGNAQSAGSTAYNSLFIVLLLTAAPTAMLMLGGTFALFA